MGVMYKLLRHKDLAVMDASATVREKRRLLTMEGTIVEASCSAQSSEARPEQLADKPFTADHILQLCKFLAEKSKRNKNLHKQQQSPRKIQTNKRDLKSKDVEDEGRNTRKGMEGENLPLFEYNRLCSEKVATTAGEAHLRSTAPQPQPSSSPFPDHLMNRLAKGAKSGSRNIYKSIATCCHIQQLSSQQGKRDILLKIRHQIFERKRLRQKALAPQSQCPDSTPVWRPW